MLVCLSLIKKFDFHFVCISCFNQCFLFYLYHYLVCCDYTSCLYDTLTSPNVCCNGCSVDMPRWKSVSLELRSKCGLALCVKPSVSSIFPIFCHKNIAIYDNIKINVKESDTKQAQVIGHNTITSMRASIIINL